MRASSSALDCVMAELTKSRHFVYHVLGNHDLYNFRHGDLLTCDHMRSSFVNKGGISTPSPGTTGYYHFSPAEGYRIIVLDNYEISMLGQDETSDSYRQAMDILAKHNRNDDQNSPGGLRSEMRRFVKFNGAVSADQLAWLDGVLQDSDMNHEVVLVAGHIPIHPGCTDAICLVWNFKDILQILHRHPCVLAYLAGHTHCSAYSQDEKGIHHIVFPGVIEAPPNTPAAHATVLLYPNCVVIKPADGSSSSDIVMNTSHLL